MKLIHLTDTHFVAPGLRLYGLDPRARLDAAIADINANHADATVAVVTGDLTHWGEAAAYRNFSECMAALRIPYIAMVGNHDRRALCLEQLRHVPRDENDFVQGVHDTAHGRFIFLDTLDETTHAGKMCERRMEWFQRTMAETPQESPIFLFMHHPPFLVGINEMDAIALRDRSSFAELVQPYRKRIRHLFFGHVHRPISGSWNGIPFSTLRGTNHQVWFDLDPHRPHLMSHEPPAYGVVLIGADSIVVHAHDFMDDSPRFPFAKHGVEDRVYALGEFRDLRHG